MLSQSLGAHWPAPARERVGKDQSSVSSSPYTIQLYCVREVVPLTNGLTVKRNPDSGLEVYVCACAVLDSRACVRFRSRFLDRVARAWRCER